MNIVDPRSGKVHNPFTKEELTWFDVLREVYSSVTMEGVYDPTKGYGVPLIAALNDGLIDAHQSIYHNPITTERMPLHVAHEKGLIDGNTYKTLTEQSIDDYRSGRKVTLLDAVASGLLDPHQKTIRLSNTETVPIQTAVAKGRLSAAIGEQLRKVDKMTFAEALGKGLLDLTSNQFTDPDSGRKMTITQALEAGYIDTGSVEAMEGGGDSNLSNIIDSDEFDANSGRIRDTKTGLYLTCRQAVERGVVDGDSLLHDIDQGNTLTLSEALRRGRIDQNGKFIDSRSGRQMTLKEAVNNDLLALIPSPMQAGQIIADAMKKRDKEGYRFSLGGAPSSGRRSRPTSQYEEVRYRTSATTLSPGRAGKEQTPFSQRRSRLFDDSAYRSMITDPQALADKQFEASSFPYKNFLLSAHVYAGDRRTVEAWCRRRRRQH